MFYMYNTLYISMHVIIHICRCVCVHVCVRVCVRVCVCVHAVYMCVSGASGIPCLYADKKRDVFVFHLQWPVE